MEISIFSAKSIEKEFRGEVTGFYFSYPEVNACELMGDQPSRDIHCIMTYDEGDWGMKNKPRLVRIDVGTLEKVGTYNINNN